MLISTLYITLSNCFSVCHKKIYDCYLQWFFLYKKVLFTVQPFGQAQHTIDFSIIRIMWLIKLHLWELGCNRMGEIIMKDVDSNLGPQNLLSGSLLERMISYHDQATCRSHWESVPWYIRYSQCSSPKQIIYGLL